MINKTNKIKHVLTEDMKKHFCSTLLLENIINFRHEYPILLEGENRHLESTLLYMHSKGYVEIKNDEYSPTEKGRDVLVNYLQKLEEFRRVYRIYSAVNTGEGTFAFEHYFDVDTDEDFNEILNDESFIDLRVALCELKGINPIEIIFLEFVDGNEFNCEENETWQADLITGLIWEDIVNIANENIHLDDLSEENYSGEDVMKLVVEAGSKLMKKLLKIQKEIDEEEQELHHLDEDELFHDEPSYIVSYVNEPVFEISYYDSYYDPYYCSPIWDCYYY